MADGICGRLDAVVDFELVEETRNVILDRAAAHEQLTADLGVVAAGGQEREDLALPLRQAAQPRRRARHLVLSATPDVIDQDAGGLRRQCGLSSRNGSNARDDLAKLGILEQVARGPTLDRS